MKVIKLGIPCLKCGTITIVAPSLKGLKDWRTGKSTINIALPELSDSEKTLLMKQTCKSCYDHPVKARKPVKYYKSLNPAETISNFDKARNLVLSAHQIHIDGNEDEFRIALKVFQGVYGKLTSKEKEQFAAAIESDGIPAEEYLTQKNPHGAVKTKKDEKIWQEAEKAFEREKKKRRKNKEKPIESKWAYVMATYKSMKGER